MFSNSPIYDFEKLRRSYGDNWEKWEQLEKYEICVELKTNSKHIERCNVDMGDSGQC